MLKHTGNISFGIKRIIAFVWDLWESFQRWEPETYKWIESLQTYYQSKRDSLWKNIIVKKPHCSLWEVSRANKNQRSYKIENCFRLTTWFYSLGSKLKKNRLIKLFSL